MTRLALPLALLTIASTAHAQRITYRFTGEVTSIDDVLTPPWDETLVGDPVEFVCDADPLALQTTFPSDPSVIAYLGAIRMMALSIGSEESTTFQPEAAVLTIHDNDTFPPECADSFFINATAPGEYQVLVFLEAQATPCPSVFTDMSMPDVLEPTDFGNRYIAVGIGGTVVRASIDSISTAFSANDNVLVPACFGDGGVTPACTPCPCSNDAALGSGGGCLNEFGMSARLVGFGSLSITAEDGADLRIGLEDATPGSFAVLVSGAGVAPLNPSNPCFGSQAGLSSPLLDGLRCAAQNVVRHGSRATNGGGNVELLAGGWSGPSGVAAGLATGGSFGAGQTRTFQSFYRTSPLGGCGTGQNTSQALSATFTP